MTVVSMSLQRAIVVADWTSELWVALIPFEKTLKTDFCKVVSESWVDTRLGCVVNMSHRVWIAFI